MGEQGPIDHNGAAKVLMEHKLMTEYELMTRRIEQGTIEHNGAAKVLIEHKLTTAHKLKGHNEVRANRAQWNC